MTYVCIIAIAKNNDVGFCCYDIFVREIPPQKQNIGKRYKCTSHKPYRAKVINHFRFTHTYYSYDMML